MSFVDPLLPRLTVNGAFMEEFLAAPGPCCALGLVEVQRRTCGFLAIRPDEILPPTVTAAGFRFGHSLQGTSQYTVVHFAFEFYGFARYHVLVRPDNPIVRRVLTRMADSGEFFSSPSMAMDRPPLSTPTSGATATPIWPDSSTTCRAFCERKPPRPSTTTR